MSDDCKKVVDHISRLIGQLKALQGYIEEGRSCKDIVHMSVSTSKSFDSLKAKIIEGFLKQELMVDDRILIEKSEFFDELKKLIKS